MNKIDAVANAIYVEQEKILIAPLNSEYLKKFVDRPNDVQDKYRKLAQAALDAAAEFDSDIKSCHLRDYVPGLTYTYAERNDSVHQLVNTLQKSGTSDDGIRAILRGRGDLQPGEIEIAVKGFHLTHDHPYSVALDNHLSDGEVGAIHAY